MFVAVVIIGVDEEPVSKILTEPGEEAMLCDLYEGSAAVRICTTREEAEAFLAAHGEAGDEDDEEDEDDAVSGS